MSERTLLHQITLPQEMKTPPYGAAIMVYDGYAAVELPFVQGEGIIVMPGEAIRIGIGSVGEGSQMRLTIDVTREAIETEDKT